MMELREWLSHVATRNGAHATSHKHYHGFAAKIRQDFPRIALTEATAYAVGGALGGNFPTWPELSQAIREVLAGTKATSDLTDQEKNDALWLAYGRKRLQEAPHKRDDILSLLRKVSWASFIALDDGHTQRMRDKHDREFWAKRGRYVDHYSDMIARLRAKAEAGDRKAQERLAQLQTYTPDDRMAAE